MILSNLDICGISEHWLHHYDLSLLSKVRPPEFHAYSMCSKSDPALELVDDSTVQEGLQQVLHTLLVPLWRLEVCGRDSGRLTLRVVSNISFIISHTTSFTQACQTELNQHVQTYCQECQAIKPRASHVTI